LLYRLCLGVLDHIYLPEPLTLATTMLLVILLTSLNYLVIWSQNRQQTALLWMLSFSVLSGLSFALRLVLPDLSGAVISPTIILLAIACVWMGCRTLAGRRPWRPALLLPSAIWLLTCCIPGFFDPPSFRFATPYLLAVPMLAMALRELWPAAEARRLARGVVSALLAIQTLACLGWGTAQAVSALRHLGLSSNAVDLPVSAFTVMGFSLVMSFAFVALVKEQSEWAYWQRAQIDPLTGVGNRRRLDESLEQAVRASRRFGRPLAVLMIDVDQFKAYNDHYGHPAGDACLRDIAGALRGGLIRRYDEVCRYGGEEFAVILRDTREAEAIAVAERLRLAVRAMSLPHAARDGAVVTISLGLAVMVPGRTGGATILDAATLIEAADRALYRAKEGGRDRVESVTEPLAGSPPSVSATATLRLDPA
jgi:diguanylate cyclase (GGDEF)-like protein